MQSTIIYPGTFDPITNGHVDLIKRALSIFEKVIVAVAKDSKKNPLFSSAKRVEMIQQVFSGDSRVDVCEFGGLLVDFAQHKRSQLILRGLRAVSDFEYEFQLAGMNRRLSSELETLFLTPSEQYAYISSSIIREIFSLGGDVSAFVPSVVCAAFKK